MSLPQPPQVIGPLSLSRVAGRGQTAHVFAGDDEQRVYKLFLRDEESTFAGERNAYATIIRAGLAQYVPAYDGVATVDAVLDENGRNVSERYLLSACLVLERLYGEPRKWRNLTPDMKKELEHITTAFGNIGVIYFDASVYPADDSGAARFIDLQRPESIGVRGYFQ